MEGTKYRRKGKGEEGKETGRNRAAGKGRSNGRKQDRNGEGGKGKMSEERGE